MVYREVDMWQILEVLRRIRRGETVSAVASATGRDRKTVRRYAELARELGWKGEPTEELAASIWRRVRPVRRDGKQGGSERKLLAHREEITGWLEDAGDGRGLRLSKVHQLLTRRGIVVPYSSLHRFAVRHCEFADRRRMTVRVAPSKPGEAAEVDFGRLGLVPHPGSGARRVLHALIVTLLYSRHQYVWTTHSQKLVDLIEGLEHAWEFFHGVVARVVIDNLKAAVVKADRFEPVFQRTFDEYANWRGFVIDACVVRHAKGKPHVERQVPYVRENLFRGEDWRDRDHVQREAVRWCLGTAGTRIHGTTRRRPFAVFENEERGVLRSLEKPRFDPPTWAPCTLHGDHHISFEKATYSAPTRYLHQKLWVRADSRLVRIYAGGELIKTHERQPPGGRSTDYADYPAHQSAYAMRDPVRIIAAAELKGEHVGRFTAKLLSGDFPWAKLRQAQKLIRLGEKYGFRRVDAACQRALAFDLINVRRVERMLHHSLDQVELPEQTRMNVIPLPQRFERESGSFVHPRPPGGDHD